MILIVSRSRKRGNQYSEIFHYMGILSHAVTPAEALREISLLYRAVLVVDPETLPNPREFIKNLKIFASIPVFSISESGPDDEHAHLFADSFREASYSGTVVGLMAQHCREHKCSPVGDYRLNGFNATPDAPSVKYFDEEIPLTKTEAMIFRYLIRTYPAPQKSAKILKYAYRPSRTPEASSVRAHICLINRKFHALVGRNLIGNVDGQGYAVLTGEFSKITATV